MGAPSSRASRAASERTFVPRGERGYIRRMQTLALVAALLAAAPAAQRIEDDYARAIAEARQRGVPVVVDVWAPW